MEIKLLQPKSSGQVALRGVPTCSIGAQESSVKLKFLLDEFVSQTKLLKQISELTQSRANRFVKILISASSTKKIHQKINSFASTMSGPLLALNEKNPDMIQQPCESAKPHKVSFANST